MPLSLALPDSNARVYLAAFKVAAIYVACVDGNTETVAVGAARDVSRALSQLTLINKAEAKPAHAVLCAVWWCNGYRTAKRVVNAVHKLTDGESQSPEHMMRLVREAATMKSIALTEHEPMMARLHAMMSRFDAQLEAAKALGHLNFFNRTYRQRRLDAAGRGERFPTYAQALRRLRRFLLISYARSDGRFEIMQGDLVRFVFEKS